MKNKSRTVFAYLFTLLAVAIRCFQLLNTVDASTGNVIVSYIPLQRYFSYGILACLITVAVLGIFSKPKTESFTLHSKSMAIISAVMACSLMFDGFKLLFDTFKDISSDSVLPFIMFGMSIIAALYFVSLSVSMFSTKNIFPNPLLPAFVIICFGIKLVTQYMLSVSNANISEHKFSILMYASFMLFWIFYARYCLKSKKSKRLVSLFSILAVFCGAITLIPRAVAVVVPTLLPTLYGSASNVFNANEFFVTDVATILFAIVFIYYMNRAEKVEEEDDDFIFEGIEGVSNDSDSSEIMQAVFGDEPKEEQPELTTDSVQSLIDEVLPELDKEDVDTVVFDETDVIPEPKKPFVVTIAPEETTEPEVTEPVIEEPVTEEPETTEPEVTEPVIEEPEIEEPEVAEPEVAEPEVEEPETTEPVIEETVIEEPEITEPEVTKAKEEEVVEEIELNASTDDIINNLLDEIMGKYGEDN